jgi:glycosyltransferase involved in cell wall biosynthesis
LRKILFIIPSLEGGGAERVLINLLHLLKEQSKFQITLCSVVKKGIYADAVPAEIGLKYLYRNALAGKIVEKCVRDYGLHFLFRTRVRRLLSGHYDVGISFLDSVFSDLLFYPDPQIDRKIIVLHSSYLTYTNFNKFIKGKYERVLQKRYERADTIVSVSHDVEREFKEAIGQFRDMRVIYNPINVDQIREKAQEYTVKRTKGRIQIVAIGSLISVKNHMRLLRSVELLVKEGLNFHLRILGKGNLQQKLQAFIDEKEMNNYVVLEGFVDNPYPILKAADIFVLSSLSEGLPTVVGEAMVLGVPVVSTNCSGSREILDNGKFGVLTEQDEFSLYEGIKQLADEGQRAYFSAKSLERAKIFDDRRALEEYISLFEENNS